MSRRHIPHEEEHDIENEPASLPPPLNLDSNHAILSSPSRRYSSRELNSPIRSIRSTTPPPTTTIALQTGERTTVVTATGKKTRPKIDDSERIVKLHQDLLKNSVLLRFNEEPGNEESSLKSLIDLFYKPAFRKCYPDMQYRDAIKRERLQIRQEEWERERFKRISEDIEEEEESIQAAEHQDSTYETED
ncbi:hypothetical protein G9A89_012872 [Geosiphon pyriformis]|nr:hypothetical protein G9A89_012872 [Geosiphon pyriformis]